MDQSSFMIDTLIFLLSAIIVVPLFQRFRSSPILGYLAAGILIGPNALGLVEDSDTVHTLAEFGVVFLLFMIGLELSFSRLRTLGKKVFGLGSLQVGVTGLLIGGVVWQLGLGLEAAAIIGPGLALSSTAFVLQLLTERGERATPYGLSTFSILLLQDFAVVPLLIFVTLLGSEGSSFVEAFGMAVLKGGAALLLVILFGRYLLKPLYRMIAAMRSTELFVSTTLLMILGTGWLMTLAGLSMELGALLAGLLLSETEYRHQIEADIKPFRGILLGLFFMTIGMAIDLGFIFEQFSTIALIVLALMAGKIIVTTLLCLLVRLPADTAIRTGFALSQGGEFGFVLFGAALALGLLPEDVAQILMAVITLSMIATPLMFFLGKKLACWLQNRKQDPRQPIDPELAETDRPVLIAGFGRVGQTVARVLSEAGISYVALDLDQNRVAACRAKGMPVFYGDANQIEVLKAAGADQASTAVITLDIPEAASHVVRALRKNGSELPIYVRARDRRHMAILEQAGASVVVSEAAEFSLQLGSILLTSLEVSADEVASIIQSHREEEYKRLGDIVEGE
ncbi:MAG: monovalent cation:proton antiporter-2 (CPA2) family protein [Rhodobacteraceae bacterium]|nr:monovalent cation:proton antiporter-2 (CPA2) family protein [Paracoccaceae bacterium]